MTHSPDRLDRIERILEATAQQSAANQVQIDANTAGFAELRQSIAETRQIADSNTRGLAETRQIVESNARAIEANSNNMAELRSELRAMQQQTRDGINDVVSLIGDLARTVDAYREEAAADRAELRRLIEAMYGDRGNGNGNAE